MPGLTLERRSGGLPDVADLLALDGIDRSGVVFRSDGVLVRVLAVTPLNPQTMDVAHVVDGFRRLVSTLAPGESLQLQAEVASTAVDGMHELAASRVDGYVIVPFAGERQRHSRTRGSSLSKRMLRRALAAQRRLMHASLMHTAGLRHELEDLGLNPRLLDGPEVARLLIERFAQLPSNEQEGRPIEVLGELDELDAADTATRAAREVARRLALSLPDFTDGHYLRIDAGLEQVAYVAGGAARGEFGWPTTAMRPGRHLVLSMHIHAVDPDEDGFDDADDEPFEVSWYIAIREPGREPDVVRLAETVDDTVAALAAAAATNVYRGEFMQRDLWASTLPLARDVAWTTQRYDAVAIASAVPLVQVACGSPRGIPFAVSPDDGAVVRLDLWDPVHTRAALLIAASGGQSASVATMLTERLVAASGSAVVLDPDDRYGLLSEVVPDARRLEIGPDDDGDTVNPWDTLDAARVSPDKVAFLLAFHELLLNEGRTLEALERERLERAIRAVYGRAVREQRAACEHYLLDELDDQALAARLAELLDDPAYAALLDSPTTVPNDGRLLVLATGGLPAEVAPAVTLALAEHATAMALRRDYLSATCHALVVGDADVLARSPAGAAWLQATARRARRLGMALVAVTERPADLATPHGQAFARSAAQHLLLGQPAAAIGLTEHETRLIAELNESDRVASSAYWINGTRGRAVVTIHRPGASFDTEGS